MSLSHMARLKEGYLEEKLNRIHAPIGLFGPREANAVAVSVLAQIFAILEKRRQ